MDIDNGDWFSQRVEIKMTVESVDEALNGSKNRLAGELLSQPSRNDS